MSYTHFEVRDALESLTVLIDTREQDTMNLRRRMKDFPHWRREKLDAGDYSGEYTVEGETHSLPVSIEREMNLDELCQCFTSGRERFQREFERGKAAGIKMYLLIENADWSKVFDGSYRSRLNPNALIASIIAWSIRYDLQFIFCKPDECGRIIYKILYYHAKEVLEHDGTSGAESQRIGKAC